MATDLMMFRLMVVDTVSFSKSLQVTDSSNTSLPMRRSSVFDLVSMRNLFSLIRVLLSLESEKHLRSGGEKHTPHYLFFSLDLKVKEFFIFDGRYVVDITYNLILLHISFLLANSCTCNVVFRFHCR